ncbi:MAG: hypothetical protein Kow00120_21300 [Anaerolineae bacterium]
MSDDLPANYDHLLREEARVWGQVAVDAAQKTPPDWQYYQHAMTYLAVYEGRWIRFILDHIRPGDRALELGCASGWMSIEMARRGAVVDAVDIAEAAIEVGRAYQELLRRREPLPGRVNYTVGDLNQHTMPRETYDAVIIKGVLHHLVRPFHVLEAVHAALKPGGVLLLIDGRDPRRVEAIIAGALLFALPTRVPYGEKIRALFRFRRQLVGKMQDIMEARGLSPFEGVTDGADLLGWIDAHFNVTDVHDYSAFIRELAEEVVMPRPLKIGVLHALNLADRALVRLGLLQGCSFLLRAEKPARA